MSVRNFNPTQDVQVHQVELKPLPQPDAEDGTLINYWIPLANGEPIIESPYVAFKSHTEAMKALNASGWLHLPVVADIVPDDFCYDVDRRSHRITLFDPSKGPYRTHLLNEPFCSVVHDDENDSLVVTFLGHDEKQSPPYVHGKQTLRDRSAKLLATILDSDASRRHKVRAVSELIEVTNPWDIGYPNSDLRMADIEDDVYASQGREKYNDDHSLQLNIIGLHDGSREPFAWAVNIQPNYWPFEHDTDLHIFKVFGDIEEARQYAVEVVKNVCDTQLTPMKFGVI